MQRLFIVFVLLSLVRDSLQEEGGSGYAASSDISVDGASTGYFASSSGDESHKPHHENPTTSTGNTTGDEASSTTAPTPPPPKKPKSLLTPLLVVAVLLCALCAVGGAMCYAQHTVGGPVESARIETGRSPLRPKATDQEMNAPHDVGWLGPQAAKSSSLSTGGYRPSRAQTTAVTDYGSMQQAP